LQHALGDPSSEHGRSAVRCYLQLDPLVGSSKSTDQGPTIGTRTEPGGGPLTAQLLSFSEIDGWDVCRVDVAASAQPVFARLIDGKHYSEFWGAHR
jgi:hypothetical protein